MTLSEQDLCNKHHPAHCRNQAMDMQLGGQIVSKVESSTKEGIACRGKEETESAEYDTKPANDFINRMRRDKWQQVRDTASKTDNRWANVILK